MCDFSEIVMLRRALIREGISFYDLEEKRSSPYESSTASWARDFMRRERISIQELKKGTIYEELERKGDMNKEEIEEKVKSMAVVKPITKADEEKFIMMMRTTGSFANEANKKNQISSSSSPDYVNKKGNNNNNNNNKRRGHKMVMRSVAEVIGKSYDKGKEEEISSITVNKDREMCRGLDKKAIQNLQKIEKQKWLEKRLAEKNRPYMGWPASTPPS